MPDFNATSLAPALIFNAGGKPNSFAVGDLNGDGIADVVLANGYPINTVSVLLGNGNGALRAPVSYPAGNNSQLLVLRDVNGDGKLDSAITISSGISVLLGNGDGTFQASRTTALSYQPSVFALGDLNNDGALDSVIGRYNDATTSTLLGSGNGTFQGKLDVAMNDYPSAIALGDFNLDKKLDCLVIGRLGQIITLIGAGNGALSVQQSIYSGQYSGSREAAFGFLNSDNVLDCAIASYNANKVLVWLGSITSSSFPTYNYNTTSLPLHIAISDISLDGNADLIIAGNNATSVLLGNGNGTFQPMTVLNGNANITDLIVSDMNGDTRPDIITLNSATGALAIALNNLPQLAPTTTITTTSTTTTTTAIPTTTISGVYNFYNIGSMLTSNAGAQPNKIVSGDLNGDNKLDVVVSSYALSTVSALLGNGDGTFRAPISFSAGGKPNNLLLGDFNNDGKLDVIAIVAAVMSVWFGNGNGGFQAPLNATLSSSSSALAIGDLNKDGNLDAACVVGAGLLAFLGNGDGTFQAPLNTNVEYSFFNIALGDINGDGNLDCAGVGFDGTSFIVYGHGNGAFQSFLIGSSSAPFPNIVLGDLNKDNKLDSIVLMYSYTTYYVRDLRSIFGQSGTAFFCNVAPSAFRAVVSDINSDNNLDIVVASGNALTLLLGDGAGRCQSSIIFTGNITITDMVVGDMNGDGKPDIITIDSARGAVSVALNIYQPPSTTTTSTTSTPSTTTKMTTSSTTTSTASTTSTSTTTTSKATTIPFTTQSTTTSSSASASTTKTDVTSSVASSLASASTTTTTTKSSTTDRTTAQLIATSKLATTTSVEAASFLSTTAIENYNGTHSDIGADTSNANGLAPGVIAGIAIVVVAATCLMIFYAIRKCAAHHKTYAASPAANPLQSMTVLTTNAAFDPADPTLDEFSILPLPALPRNEVEMSGSGLSGRVLDTTIQLVCGAWDPTRYEIERLQNDDSHQYEEVV